jgi:TonB family protein
MFTILASAAVKSALVFALAWMIAKLMQRASAAARHLVWTAAAAVVIALPFVSTWMPAWKISTPAAWRETAAVFRINVTGTNAPEDVASIPARGGSALAQAITKPGWRTIVTTVWAIGTASTLLEMLLGCAAIWRLRKSVARSQRVDGVELLETPAGSMPMAAGIWKPAVFLPGDAAEWPEERRRAVLAHELAHVHRADAATQFMARIAVALYWWNPLAWMAWREFLKERERAADDLVLASGLTASDYAAHLLEIARRRAAPAPSMSLAMARTSQLEGRLLAILDSNVSRKSAGRWSALAAAACAVAVMTPLAAVRAQDNSALPADAQAAIRSAQSQRDPGMLEKIADAAEAQRKFDVARTMLEAAAQIRAQVSGATSPEYGIGVLKLADLEKREHGVGAGAAKLYSQAADVLTNRPEAAPALVNLGEVALQNKDLDGAATYFQKAQAADPAKAGIAMMWLADVRDKQRNFDEAEALYRSAISLEDPKSLDAAITMSKFARYLTRAGRIDVAAAFSDRAKQAYAANSSGGNTASTTVFKIGAGVKPPSVLSKVEPGYAEEARLATFQGTVVLSVVIAEDGTAQNIMVVRPLGMGLDDKAVQAVSKWKFNPGMKNGEAVPVIATIEVNFNLL